MLHMPHFFLCIRFGRYLGCVRCSKVLPTSARMGRARENKQRTRMTKKKQEKDGLEFFISETCFISLPQRSPQRRRPKSSNISQPRPGRPLAEAICDNPHNQTLFDIFHNTGMYLLYIYCFYFALFDFLFCKTLARCCGYILLSKHLHLNIDLLQPKPIVSCIPFAGCYDSCFTRKSIYVYLSIPLCECATYFGGSSNLSLVSTDIFVCLAM